MDFEGLVRALARSTSREDAELGEGRRAGDELRMRSMSDEGRGPQPAPGVGDAWRFDGF